MTFDTALSGIRAASSDLSVTGNNIANASTTGFKSSRTEFADVYATSVLGSGSNAVGSGVQVANVGQAFTQGNVAFTEKELDLAINGNGFFVLSQGGEIQYSRSGAFGLDDDGFIVNSSNARLQGFPADAAGNIGGIEGDIEIETSNLDPRRTTGVNSILNLDASEEVLQTSGRQLVTEGVDIAVAQVGLQSAETTELVGGNFTLAGITNNFSTTPMNFDVSLGGQGTNIGTVSINLDSASGVPATIGTFNDLRILASVINNQIFSPTAPQTSIDIVAEAVDQGGGNFGIEFKALEEGLNSTITIAGSTANAAEIGISDALVSSAGIPAVTNGYPAQAVDITGPDGTVTYNTRAGATAASTAAELNALQGVSATAQTDLTLSNFVSSAGNLTVSINGVSLEGDSLEVIASEVNGLTNTTLPGISAVFDPVTLSLAVTSAGGDDIEVSITSIDDQDSITVTGDVDAGEQILEVDTNGALVAGQDAASNSIVVGGQLSIVFDDGYDIAVQTAGGLFQPLNDSQFTNIVINEFDPGDQATYNSATSMTIYDSLGIAHVMTQYFVKQEFDAADPTSAPNHWQVHVQIDGQDVGDPDTTLPAPDNTVATRATYNVFFNDDGTLNPATSEDVLVSNWVPLDEDGNPSAAAGPQNLLAGGTLPIPEPPTSSNFLIDFEGTTQFGSAFSVNDVDQDGFATGRLSGLSIDNSGVIFARFTNGESQILGQVALASFQNQEGLQPAGGSAWVENFESGPPNIAGANTGSLGTIQSGALEESNVDLSAELVNLIIAQRNFQASAKTIETADTVTQTIINLR